MSLFFILIGVALVLVLVLGLLVVWPMVQGGGGLQIDAAMALLAGRLGCRVLSIGGFLFIFMCAGLFVMGMGIRELQQSKQSENWPVAEGSIASSEVGTHDSDGTTMYTAKLTYNYAVGGVWYTGDQVTFSDISQSNSRPAQETVSRYPVGAPVYVYYDPAEPSTAVLEPGISGGVWLPLGVGGVFVGVSALMLIGGGIPLLRRGLF